MDSTIPFVRKLLIDARARTITVQTNGDHAQQQTDVANGPAGGQTYGKHAPYNRTSRFSVTALLDH